MKLNYGHFYNFTQFKLGFCHKCPESACPWALQNAENATLQKVDCVLEIFRISLKCEYCQNFYDATIF